jgi:hypothetical protein
LKAAPLLGGLPAVGCASVQVRLPEEQATLAAPQAGVFQAGAARADITPPPRYPMAGYFRIDQFARGHWLRLYARAAQRPSRVRADRLARNRSFDAFLRDPEAAELLAENASLQGCDEPRYAADACSAVDSSVHMLRFDDAESGAVRAAAVFFAAHPTVARPSFAALQQRRLRRRCARGEAKTSLESQRPSVQFVHPPLAGRARSSSANSPPTGPGCANILAIGKRLTTVAATREGTRGPHAFAKSDARLG